MEVAYSSGVALGGTDSGELVLIAVAVQRQAKGLKALQLSAIFHDAMPATREAHQQWKARQVTRKMAPGSAQQ